MKRRRPTARLNHHKDAGEDQNAVAVVSSAVVAFAAANERIFVCVFYFVDIIAIHYKIWNVFAEFMLAWLR